MQIESDSESEDMTGFFCLAWWFQVYLHYSIYQNSIPLCLYILVLLYLSVNQLSVCLCVHASVTAMVHIWKSEDNL